MSTQASGFDHTGTTAGVLASELRVVIARLTRRLREQATLGDLTWTQLQVLSRLEKEGPATVSALAKIEGMRPQSMGETIAALKALGYVDGIPDPNDRRQTVLSLTAACIAAISAGRTAREDWLFHGIRTRLAANEQQELVAALALLKRLVDA